MVEATPEHAGPGHRHADHRRPAAADGARHRGGARARAEEFGDDWLRV